MARFVFRGPILRNSCGSIPTDLAGSIFKKILIVGAWVLALTWVHVAVAQAPHGGGHVGGGGHAGGGAHMSAPVRAPISAPRGVVGPREVGPRGVGPHGVGRSWVGPYGAGPRLAGFGPRGFGFRQGPIHVFRRRVFFGAPFFRFGVGLGFNSLWWPTCGPSLGWAWGGGFDCYPAPFYGYSYQDYVTMQTYQEPVYVYGGEERDLIWLYLKDGTVYDVTDYWLVNGQMHFSLIEDDPTKPVEHTIPYDDVDVQKTIYVNSHRGFRIVFRDEPWQQYLKDHPDLTPTDVPPPQTN
jgi:hypothetical protein